MLLVDSIAEFGRGGGELDARVHPFRLTRLGRVGRDAGALFDQQSHRIGQVELPLRVRGIDSLERRPQLLGVEDVDRRVELGDRLFVLAEVGGLDDRADRAVVAPHDPAVATRVLERECEHRGRGVRAAMGLEEPLERLGPKQRGVARKYEHVALMAVERPARRVHRVAGPQRLFLNRDLEIVERLGLCGRDDNDQRVGIEAPRRFGHPVDEPSAQEPVEGLRRLGAHARAETACEDDSGESGSIHGRHENES